MISLHIPRMLRNGLLPAVVVIMLSMELTIERAGGGDTDPGFQSRGCYWQWT